MRVEMDLKSREPSLTLGAFKESDVAQRAIGVSIESIWKGKEVRPSSDPHLRTLNLWLDRAGELQQGMLIARLARVITTNSRNEEDVAKVSITGEDNLRILQGGLEALVVKGEGTKEGSALLNSPEQEIAADMGELLASLGMATLTY